MDLNKPGVSLTRLETAEATENLARSKFYASPRRVWVEDGHVYVEGHDGEFLFMTPEVAIGMGRLLAEAGSDALVNRVMDEASKRPT